MDARFETLCQFIRTKFTTNSRDGSNELLKTVISRLDKEYRQPRTKVCEVTTVRLVNFYLEGRKRHHRGAFQGRLNNCISLFTPLR